MLIRTEDGQERHGVVLEVDGDLAVVQVFEGTAGLDPQRTRVRCSGSPLRIPVGEGWLGRICSGRGEPLDGGPPVVGTRQAATNGAPPLVVAAARQRRARASIASQRPAARSAGSNRVATKPTANASMQR